MSMPSDTIFPDHLVSGPYERVFFEPGEELQYIRNYLDYFGGTVEYDFRSDSCRLPGVDIDVQKDFASRQLAGSLSLSARLWPLNDDSSCRGKLLFQFCVDDPCLVCHLASDTA